jgi:hypothetical protein
MGFELAVPAGEDPVVSVECRLGVAPSWAPVRSPSGAIAGTMTLTKFQVRER